MKKYIEWYERLIGSNKKLYENMEGLQESCINKRLEMYVSELSADQWGLRQKSLIISHSIVKPCSHVTFVFASNFKNALLAIIDKFDVPIRQSTWLYQAFLGVSIKKLTLWIKVWADDQTAKIATIDSNGFCVHN